MHDDGSDAANLCFHCGQPVPAGESWTLDIGGLSRTLCCVGCQSVARLIVESGCEDFYLRRTVPSARIDPEHLLPPELALVDLPVQTAEGEVSGAGDHAQELVLSIDGLRCAACVWLIEKYLARLPGIDMAELNVASARLHIRRDPARCSTSTILRGLHGPKCAVSIPE